MTYFTSSIINKLLVVLNNNNYRLLLLCYQDKEESKRGDIVVERREVLDELCIHLLKKFPVVAGLGVGDDLRVPYVEII